MNEATNHAKGETEEKPKKGTLILTFLSDGSIDMNADGTIGMLDLWAASRLLEVKGDEIYVMGNRMMKDAIAAEEAKDPTRRIVTAKQIPEARA